MKISLKDERSIVLFSDEQKNIVIFPKGEGFGGENLKGEKTYGTFPSLYPIELKYPYSEDELAEKIKQGIEEWCKHPAREYKENGKTYEEAYYGIKGFKNAVKGKRYFSIGWDEWLGVHVSFMLPCKSGYAYLGMERRKLPDDADWIDFARAVIELINKDLTELKTFKTYKSKLNI